MPGSGIIYTLTVSAAEDTARLLREAGSPGARLHGPHRHRSARGAGAPAQGQRAQGAGRHQRARHGFRQARPRLRDPPRCTVLAGCLLPAGRPRRPCHRECRRAAAARAAKTPTSGTTSPRRRCPTRCEPPPSSMRSATRRSRRPALEALVDLRRTPLELLLKVLDVDGAVRRGQRGMDLHRTAVDVRQGALRAHRRGARGRAAVDGHLRDLDAPAAWRCCRPISTIRLRRRADGATTVPVPGTPLPSTTLRRRSQRRRSTRSASRSIRERSGRPARRTPRARSREDERVEPGRAVARLTDLGWGGTLREVFAAGAAGRSRSPMRCSVPAYACSRTGTGLSARRGRQHPVAVQAAARRLVRAGHRQDRAAPRPRHPRPRRRRAREASPAATAPTDSRACGVRSPSAPSSPSGSQALEGKPILLIDDRVDSRWTMTVAGRELRLNGAGPVLPFALAVVA